MTVCPDREVGRSLRQQNSPVEQIQSFKIHMFEGNIFWGGRLLNWGLSRENFEIIVPLTSGLDYIKPVKIGVVEKTDYKN